MGDTENIYWKNCEILEKQKATPIGTLSVQLKISRLVWLDGTPGGIRTPGLLVRRLSQGQIGAVSAPICAICRRSLDEFSIVSVQPCPLFSDSGSKLGQDMRKPETYRNEIKSYIVRTGMTMTEVVDYLSDEYGWSRSVPNLSGKLKRDSLRYGEAVELADALGYDIVWEKR